MKKLRVATVVGTRPEIIRLSRLVPLLDEHTEHTFIHTGQNHDPNLKDVFFRDLQLREPDFYLGVSTSSPMTSMAETLIGVENVLQAGRFDAFLVLGDTNSAIAILVARRMGIPSYHLEAGNRSFDANVPEEINRRMVDHLATFNLPYSEAARRNLLAEGIHPRFISLSGSPMPEVLTFYRNQILESSVLGSLGVKSGEYFLVSAHRQENVDSAKRLETLVTSLNKLCDTFDSKIIFPVHPRTRAKLDGLDIKIDDRVLVSDPLGFFDFVALQKSARCVLSDSGTISEESAILGFPALTIRDSMERPEALETGSMQMVGLDFDEIIRGIVRLERRESSVEVPIDYTVSNFSERVLGFIESTAPRVASWIGQRANT